MSDNIPQLNLLHQLPSELTALTFHHLHLRETVRASTLSTGLNRIVWTKRLKCLGKFKVGFHDEDYDACVRYGQIDSKLHDGSKVHVSVEYRLDSPRITMIWSQHLTKPLQFHDEAAVRYVTRLASMAHSMELYLSSSNIKGRDKLFLMRSPIFQAAISSSKLLLCYTPPDSYAELFRECSLSSVEDLVLCAEALGDIVLTFAKKINTLFPRLRRIFIEEARVRPSSGLLLKSTLESAKTNRKLRKVLPLIKGIKLPISEQAGWDNLYVNEALSQILGVEQVIIRYRRQEFSSQNTPLKPELITLPPSCRHFHLRETWEDHYYPHVPRFTLDFSQSEHLESVEIFTQLQIAITDVMEWQEIVYPRFFVRLFNAIGGVESLKRVVLGFSVEFQKDPIGNLANIRAKIDENRDAFVEWCAPELKILEVHLKSYTEYGWKGMADFDYTTFCTDFSDMILSWPSWNQYREIASFTMTRYYPAREEKWRRGTPMSVIDRFETGWDDVWFE